MEKEREDDGIETGRLASGYVRWYQGFTNGIETFAKRPFLPNFCACPVECAAYSSGVRLKF